MINWASYPAHLSKLGNLGVTHFFIWHTYNRKEPFLLIEKKTPKSYYFLFLRASWSLFSQDSEVSRNSIFSTNLGTYCNYYLFKGPWKRFEAIYSPEKDFEKNSIFSLIGRSDLRSSSPIWRSKNGLTPKKMSNDKERLTE